MKELVIVEAPHFGASMVIDGDRVVEAAPILRWTLKKPWKAAQRYFNQKGYKVTVVPDPAQKV